MADNTTLNTGVGGDVISTDDIAGVKVQRVKVQHGADGAATDVSTASPLPTEPRTNMGVSLVNVHDSPAGTSGQLTLRKAQSTIPTSVNDEDAVYARASLKGDTVTTRSPRELVAQAWTPIANSTTETEILAAGAAGVFHDLTMLVLSNTGTSQDFSLRESTGGPILIVLRCNSDESPTVLRFDPPLKQSSPALSWTMQCGGNTNSLYVYAQAIKTTA